MLISIDSVEYEPEEAGVHDIQVTLEGEPIKGSTFHVDIKPGAWPANTSIDAYQFTIVLVLSFSISTYLQVTRDKRNKNKTFGGENIKCLINQGSIESKVADNGDGSYTVSYSLPGSGQYQFNVLLNDQDIKVSLTLIYLLLLTFRDLLLSRLWVRFHLSTVFVSFRDKYPDSESTGDSQYNGGVFGMCLMFVAKFLLFTTTSPSHDRILGLNNEVSRQK